MAIKHLVVVMMENRSFDHLLGYLESATYPIRGLLTPQSNLNTQGKAIAATSDAELSGDLNPDPGHSFRDVHMQLYGGFPPNGIAPAALPAVPPMTGFVTNYFEKTRKVPASERIMKCFDPAKVPVITQLAKHYCVCDNWFSSIPGPTLCNRAYAHAATSIGRVDTGPLWEKISKTIYELLAERNVASKIYYNDFTVAMTFPKLIGAQNRYFGKFPDFVFACQQNKLPAYSFLEPRYYSTDSPGFLPAEDQHPDHNVRAGDMFLRRVYEALTANRQVWEETLLCITYDEHGGTYDHVPPPATVNPDNKNCTSPPFDFTRLGVRVPAILVSPWIEKGRIDHTLYDHASIPATARRMFTTDWQTNALTARDAAAQTFESQVTLTAPRTDALDFSDPHLFGSKSIHSDFHSTTSMLRHAAGEPLLPLSEFQAAQVEQAARLEAALPARFRTHIAWKKIKTEREAARYINEVTEALTDYGKPLKLAQSKPKKRPAKAAKKAVKKAAKKAPAKKAPNKAIQRTVKKAAVKKAAKRGGKR